MRRVGIVALYWLTACSSPPPVPDSDGSPTEGGADPGAGGVSGTDADGLAGGEAGAEAAAGAPPANTPLLYVTAASPSLDALDVYPAALWRGNGEEVAIDLSFSAPMKQTQDLFLKASDHVRPLEATWSSDAMHLTLVARPDFAFTRPLADTTEYALDASSLVSEQGGQLEPDVALRGGRLVFTTGRHDALLNHSCGHTFFGPFASVGSSQVPDETAPDIGTTHTQYAVTLGEDESGYGGWLRATFATPGRHRLYFDGKVDLFVSGGDAGSVEAVALTSTPLACPGIVYEATLSPEHGDELFIHLQAAQKPLRRVIVELVPDESPVPP